MRSGDLAPFGVVGGAVEVDETGALFNPDHEPMTRTRMVIGVVSAIVALVIFYSTWDGMAHVCGGGPYARSR